MTSRSYTLLAIVTLLFISSTLSEDITGSQLKALVKRSDELVFVSFSSALTGDQNDEYKKQIADELNNAVEYLKRDGIYDGYVRFETVFIDKNPEVFTEYGLTSIPAFGIFRDGYMRIYQGQRSAYPIYNFVKSLVTKSNVAELDSKASKKQFNALKTVRVVGYFKDRKSSAAKAFDVAARRFQGEIDFGLITDLSVAKSYKITKENQVAIVKPSEKTENLGTFSDPTNLIAIIEQNKEGLWMVLSFANIYELWENGYPAVCAFSKDVNQDKALLSAFSSLAKENKDENLKFALVTADVFPEFIKRVGLELDELPALGVIDSRKQEEYFFPKDSKITSGAVKRWLKQYQSGKLVAQTPPIYPASQYAVTKDNFEQVITNGNADVLLQFYVDEDPECQELSQFYDSLAQLFNPSGNLFVGVYNVEKHGLPDGVSVNDYPYIQYYKADGSDPATFVPDDQDTKVGLLSFILNKQSKLNEQEIETITQVIVQYQEKQFEALKEFEDEDSQAKEDL